MVPAEHTRDHSTIVNISLPLSLSLFPPNTQAIALAKVIEGSAKQDDFADSVAGFYLLKYGTPQPVLSRQDSTIRGMKFQATIARQRKRLSGKKNSIQEGRVYLASHMICTCMC